MALDDPPRFDPAPWTVQGEALVALKLLRKEVAQQLVPAGAKLLVVWPGRALGMLCVAEYRQTPVGEYREVIVAPAIIRRGARIGFWISHIVVDHGVSVLAGRSIWSLPKQLATIHWQRAHGSSERVEVPQLNLSVAFTSPGKFMRLPFAGAAISGFGFARKFFTVRGSARVGIARAGIDLKGDALGQLGMSGRSRIFVCRGLRVKIGPPDEMGTPDDVRN